jgi:Ca2+-binding EF-hand superfamily protein
LSETFFALNKSNSGEMSRDELIQAYWDNGYKDMSYYEIDKILALVDYRKSGTVNFEDYLMPSVDPVDIISREMKCHQMI